MKVLVLGGAGGMGQVAVREAVRFDFVESVTVADLHAEHAAEVAALYPGKAGAIGLDINDRAAMGAAITAHDVVLNAVGPFYTHGLPVLEQVIDAGRHYADICDDWEPTLDMLALSRRAEERGVTAVIGIGASPGVTNMIALKAARALDEVDDLLTCWSIEGSDEDLEAMRSQRPRATGASAAVVHWVQQLTGTIRVLADGGFQDVKPLTSRTIHYPGRGEVVTWSVGHPEAVTLPRAVPGLLHCANAMVGPPESFEGLAMIAQLVDSGALTIHQAADAILASMQEKAAAPVQQEEKARVVAPPLFAWASGRRNGRPAIATAEVHSMPAGGMAGSTSVPFALVLPLFANGLGMRHGVFAPEEIIDPDDFLDRLAPLCAGNFASGRELVSVTCEEQDG
jgi:saccharopine dehydrogenase-like NADP-dependent oxidoreductase